MTPLAITPQAERRQLQIALAVAACVPLLGGLWGATRGAPMFGNVPASGSFDSHLRYLSGLLMGIGLIALSCVPNVEAHGRRLGLLVLVVVAGGLMRLYGTPQTGFLSPFIFLPLIMELVVTPGLWLWHRRVTRRLAEAPSAFPG